MKTQKFYIDDMECIACSTGVEKALRKKEYVKEINVNLLSKEANITYDESQISLDKIFAFITKLGYTPYIESKSTQSVKQSTKSGILNLINSLDERFLPPKLKLWLMGISTLIVVILSYWDMIFGIMLITNHNLNNLILLFASLVVMHMAREIFFKGFKGIFSLMPNMDSLVALGVSAAFVYSAIAIFTHGHGYFESICVILFFITIGKVIEGDSKKRAQESANALLNLTHKKVIRIGDDKEELIDSIHIKKGDILKVLPNEMIMTESTLLAKSAQIDMSSINGEALPRSIKQGEYIISGSINKDQSIHIQAQSNGDESRLIQIKNMIELARNTKIPLSSAADKLASILVPIVIALAFVGAFTWLFIDGRERAIEVFLSVLVITCPCALGLAIPMAVLNTQALSNKLGIFFRNTKSIETLNQIDCVVFDKTGTLSDALEIKDIEIFADKTKQEILNIACSLESLSSHIIADTFRNIKDATLKNVHDFREMSGFGIEGKIDRIKYVLAKAEYFDLPNNEASKIEIYLAENDKVIAKLVLQDHPKSEAKDVIDFIKNDSKIQEIHLLSGDNLANTREFANIIGIEKYKSDALPESKLQYIKDLQNSGKKVLMIGDGINDSIALSQADASMAINLSSSVSSNLSDILLSNLKGVQNALLISKYAFRNIKQNLFWAFGYNIIFIPLALGVGVPFGIHLSPIFCAIAMSMSSISVVINASRLRYMKL